MVSALDILNANNVSSGYGGLQVLRDVSLKVCSGELVSVVGPNGAGKTTLLRTLIGLLKLWSGNVVFKGIDVSFVPTFERTYRGIMFIKEAGGFFPGMSVNDNLQLATLTMKSKDEKERRMARLGELFPILEKRRSQRALTLSGGERKMLGLARCFISKPELVMIDEQSLDLAPKTASEVMSAINTMKNEGISVLLVEQDIYRVAATCDRLYLLDEGKVIMQGKGQELIENPIVKKTYLAI